MEYDYLLLTGCSLAWADWNLKRECYLGEADVTMGQGQIGVSPCIVFECQAVSLAAVILVLAQGLSREGDDTLCHLIAEKAEAQTSVQS